MMSSVWRGEIQDEEDVIAARQHARGMARELGFGITDQTRIATAVSEMARLMLPTRGALALATVIGSARKGLECACSLGGPIPGTMSSSGGTEAVRILQGVQQLMDDVAMESRGWGTTIAMRKWVR